MANPNPLEMLCDYALYRPKSTFTLQSISGQPRWASYKWNWKDTSPSAVFTNVQSIPISLFNYCSLFHPVYLTSNCLSVTHKLYPDSLWSTSLGLISSTSVYTSIIHGGSKGGQSRHAPIRFVNGTWPPQLARHFAWADGHWTIPITLIHV